MPFAAAPCSIHSAFEEDITKIWDFETSVDQYNATGGTGRISVQGQIDALKVRARPGAPRAP